MADGGVSLAAAQLSSRLYPVEVQGKLATIWLSIRMRLKIRIEIRIKIRENETYALILCLRSLYLAFAFFLSSPLHSLACIHQRETSDKRRAARVSMMATITMALLLKHLLISTTKTTSRRRRVPPSAKLADDFLSLWLREILESRRQNESHATLTSVAC